MKDDMNYKHVKPRSHLNLSSVFIYCLPNVSVYYIIAKLMKNNPLHLLQNMKIKIFDILTL